MNRNNSLIPGDLGEKISYIFNLIYIFCPLLILRLDLLISIFLLVIMMVVPVWGEGLRFVLYVWALSTALSQPVDVYSVLFFICAGLYFITSLRSLILYFLQKKK